jgi:hypothetical protein
MAFSPENPQRLFAFAGSFPSFDYGAIHSSWASCLEFTSSLALRFSSFRFATPVLSNQEIANATCSG